MLFLPMSWDRQGTDKGRQSTKARSTAATQTPPPPSEVWGFVLWERAECAHAPFRPNQDQEKSLASLLYSPRNAAVHHASGGAGHQLFEAIQGLAWVPATQAHSDAVQHIT